MRVRNLSAGNAAIQIGLNPAEAGAALHSSVIDEML